VCLLDRDGCPAGAGVRMPHAGRSQRPRPATQVAGPARGRVAVPPCAVHDRAGGRVLPSCTDAWSSLCDPGSWGLACTARPVTSGATFGHGRAPWPGRHPGPARRAEGPHVRGARAGPSASRYGFASLSSPRQAAMSGPVTRGPDRGGTGFWEGCYEPARRAGVTRRCACGWNLRDAARWHGSAASPARGTAVPAGDRLNGG